MKTVLKVKKGGDEYGSISGVPDLPQETKFA
jgi:hypothetical protein